MEEVRKFVQVYGKEALGLLEIHGGDSGALARQHWIGIVPEVGEIEEELLGRSYRVAQQVRLVKRGTRGPGISVARDLVRGAMSNHSERRVRDATYEVLLIVQKVHKDATEKRDVHKSNAI